MKHFILSIAILLLSLNSWAQQPGWPVFTTTSPSVKEVTFSPLASAGYLNATDENGIVIANYKAVNTAYDENGNDIFFVLGTNSKIFVYDNSGNKYLNQLDPISTPYHIAQGSGMEIAIVPIPNTCGKIYHIVTGGWIYAVNVSTKEILCRTKYGDGVNTNSSPQLDQNEYPVAVSRLDKSGYFIYHIEANNHGLATGRYLTTSRVEFCGGAFTIGCPGVSVSKSVKDITGFGMLTTNFHTLLSEMEVSPDQSYLSFADDHNIFVFQLNATGYPASGSYYHAYQYVAGGSNIEITGIEFNAASNKLFCMRADYNTSPSVNSLIAIDLVALTNTLAPVSPAEASSFLELATDNNIYLGDGSILKYIDQSTNSLVSTVVACPVKMNVNHSIHQVKTLPDQVDGFTLTAAYLNPVYALDDLVITSCIGKTEFLFPEALRCIAGATHASWTGSHVSMLSVDADGNATLVIAEQHYEFTVEITSVHGCVLKQKVIINSPAVPEETIDKYFCYGEGLEMPVILDPGCQGMGMEWFEFNPATNLYDVPFYSGLTYTLTAVPAQTLKLKAVCYDQNGCIIKNTYYNIYVSPPPTWQMSTQWVCAGGTLTLDPNFLCSHLPGTVAEWHGPVSYDANGNVLLSPTTTIGDPIYVECKSPFGNKMCPTAITHVEVNVYAFQVEQFMYRICEGDNFTMPVFINLPGTPDFTCHYEKLGPGGVVLQVYSPGVEPTVDPGVGVYLYKKVCTTPEGCYKEDYFEIYREPTSTYEQTIPVSCSQTVDLNSYNTNGCTDVLWNNANVHPNPTGTGAYVYIPPIQVITGSTTFYGFGRDAAGNCCKIILHFTVTPPVVRMRDLCFNGTPIIMDNNWFCPSGSTCTWYVDGVPAPTPFMIDNSNFNKNIRVECTDPVTGCLLYKTQFNITFDPNCEQEILCYYQELTMQAGCPPGTVTIEWYKNGSLYMTNQTFLIASPITGPDPSVTYVILCKDASGNILKQKRFFIIDCSSPQRSSAPKKREDIAGSPDMVKIYPNPSAGVFSVDVQDTDVTEMRIEVYDVLGQLIFKKISSGNTSIDLRDQPAGTYMVKLNTGGEDFFRKVVVIKN